MLCSFASVVLLLLPCLSSISVHILLVKKLFLSSRHLKLTDTQNDPMISVTPTNLNINDTYTHVCIA